MKLYVISADTYNGSWGSRISMFGVFDEEHVYDALEELQKEYDYYFEVNEISLNEYNETYLGGYFEQMKLRFHLGNNIMKIKFKNENYLEPIKSTDIKRSYRVDKLKEFYLKYPDVFLENYFDIELLEYQKLFIRLIVRDTDK